VLSQHRLHFTSGFFLPKQEYSMHSFICYHSSISCLSCWQVWVTQLCLATVCPRFRLRSRRTVCLRYSWTWYPHLHIPGSSCQNFCWTVKNKCTNHVHKRASTSSCIHSTLRLTLYVLGVCLFSRHFKTRFKHDL
jgi:hypothetical protein